MTKQKEPHMLPADALPDLLRAQCKAAGGVTAWSIAHSMAASYVYMVGNGSRTFGPKMLRAMGLRKSVGYVIVDGTAGKKP